MNNIKYVFSRYVTVWIVMILCILGLVIVHVYTQREIAQLTLLLNEVENTGHEHAGEIAELQKTTHSLSTVQNDMLSTVEMMEHTRGEIQENIEGIRDDIDEREKNQEARDIATVVGEWGDRIARVACTFNEEGRRTRAMASGVGMYVGSQFFVMTNKHLVEDNGVLEKCTIIMPQHGIEEGDISTEVIRVSEERDIAYIKVDNPGRYIPIDHSQHACTQEPERGDRVIILGFPRVGARESITVTEGIISGFEDDYYISSAKIEQGNSGGAALLTEHNCLVGIPTRAVVGRIESLARILPVSSLTSLNL